MLCVKKTFSEKCDEIDVKTPILSVHFLSSNLVNNPD